MFTFSHDIAWAAAVWLFAGRSNTDEDFERYIDTFRRLASLVEGRDAPAGILLTDPGNPPPNAPWRRRIAEASKDIDSKAIFAMVSASPLVRATVTAVNWIRPPAFHVGTFATFDAATAWVEEIGGPPPRVYRALLVEARAKAEAEAP